MKYIKTIALCFVFTCFFSGIIGAEEPENELVVSVATNATIPPLAMLDHNSHIVGFNIDYMNAVAKEAGFKVIIQNSSWKDIFSGFKTGTYDAVIGVVERKEKSRSKLDFSFTYLTTDLVLVVPSASKAFSIPDMGKATIGVRRGSSFSIEDKKTSVATLKSYNSLDLAFEALAAGNIDGVVCNRLLAVEFTEKNQVLKGKFKIAEKPVASQNFSIAVKKGNDSLLNLINKGIQAVKDRGIDSELREKWFN